MVVLVRCTDETFSVALESNLEGLVKGGLIKAYLDKDQWVTVPAVMHSRRGTAARRPAAVRGAAAAAV